MNTTNIKQANQIRGIKKDIADIKEDIRDTGIDIAGQLYFMNLEIMKVKKPNKVEDFILTAAACAAGVMLVYLMITLGEL